MSGPSGPIVVSLIVPTYDRASLIERALASVAGQTRLPDEVIVVDDGSRDATSVSLRRWSPLVRYVRQPHRGVSAARNHGIRIARGNWIALLDSDDEWLPHKLQRQLEELQEHPDYRICHTDEIWVRRGRRVNPARKHAKSGGYIFSRCLPLCAISPSSVLLSRSLLDEVGLFDEQLPACEDYDLWLRICARHPVLFVNEALVIKHGGHADQLSSQHWGMDRFRISALERILKDPDLGAEDRRAAWQMLVRKIEIYLLGARKRSKWEDVERYERLLSSWQSEDHALQGALR